MELSDKELINLKSYSHPKALKLYDSDKLKSIEEIVIKKFFIKPGAKVLDIGCGCGRTTINLKRMGYQVIGIDIVPSMIEVAKKKYPDINFKVMNVCQMEFPNQSFDYALFSYNGLDYVYPKTKRVLALKEIYRVLKKDGLFAFSAHNSLRIPTSIGSLIFMVRNILNLRIFTNYRVEKDIFGTLFTHYQSPLSQIKELTQVGFKNIQILSNVSTNKWKIYFLDKYPYYICSK